MRWNCLGLDAVSCRSRGDVQSLFLSWLTWLAAGVYSVLLELKVNHRFNLCSYSFSAMKAKGFPSMAEKSSTLQVMMDASWSCEIRHVLWWPQSKQVACCCSATLVTGPGERRHLNTKPGWRFNVLNSSGSELVAVAENRGWMERTHKTRWTATEGGKTLTWREPTIPHFWLRADEWTLLLKLIPRGEDWPWMSCSCVDLGGGGESRSALPSLRTAGTHTMWENPN